MFKNSIKIAIRNIQKYKAYSVINVVGLAIGIACCILILLYVIDELSYDKHHEKAKQIYRICLKGLIKDNEVESPASSPAMAATLVRDFPEVTHAARILPESNILIRYGEKVFHEDQFFWADSSIFDIFTLPLLKGDARTALNRPNTIILTEKTAKKYFGDEDVIGKSLMFEDSTLYEITGITSDVPKNAHFHYDLIASFVSRNDTESQIWVNNYIYTYILLQESFDPIDLEIKFPAMVKKYVGPQVQRALGLTFDEFIESGFKYGFYLQPLLDIHLHSDLDGEIEANSDIRYVYIFTMVAIFILLIACINFMNLATARSANRAKEVGVRKVLGSSGPMLIRQFLSESIFLAFIAVSLSILLVELALPAFNALAGKELTTSYLDNWFAIPALIVVVIGVGLIAGSYPAFYLAAFQPVSVLKGKQSEGVKSSGFRSGLVIFQFSISIFLFISTLVVFNQLKYIQNKKLGFDKEQVVVVQRTWALGQKRETFKNELLQYPTIVNAASSDAIPGRLYSNSIYQTEGRTADEQNLLWQFPGDDDLVETLKLEILEGRDFSRTFTSDTLSVLLNESAIKACGLNDPIGKRLIQIGVKPEDNRYLTIIGILKDFHFESLHQKIRPLIMALNRGQSSQMFIRIQTENIASTLKVIEDKWKQFVPGKPFNFFFLDDDFNQLYQAEQRTGQIFTTFSILAIFIACLGLFGLASFTTEQRTKEIGVRKILGASVANIILNLTKEFSKWVLIANIIAWPVAYLIMNNWLQNFAYRINLNLWTFLFAAIITLFIALMTVSYQAIKAALTNPVDALRYE